MLKKIIFMGTPIFAVPILKSLYQNGYPVSVVYSQPPKKSSRGMKTQKSPVHLMAETLNIEARTPDVLKGNSIEEFNENLKKVLDGQKFGIDFEKCIGTVSYTHLTLPTKRIV